MRKEEQEEEEEEEERGGQFASVQVRLWELDLKLRGKLCAPYVKFCKGGFHCAPYCVCVCACICVCVFSVSE